MAEAKTLEKQLENNQKTLDLLKNKFDKMPRVLKILGAPLVYRMLKNTLEKENSSLKAELYDTLKEKAIARLLTNYPKLSQDEERLRRKIVAIEEKGALKGLENLNKPTVKDFLNALILGLNSDIILFKKDFEKNEDQKFQRNNVDFLLSESDMKVLTGINWKKIAGTITKEYPWLTKKISAKKIKNTILSLENFENKDLRNDIKNIIHKNDIERLPLIMDILCKTGEISMPKTQESIVCKNLTKYVPKNSEYISFNKEKKGTYRKIKL